MTSDHRQDLSSPTNGRLSRRGFLGSILVGAAGLCGGVGSVGLYASTVEPYRPVVEKVEIGLPDYPADAPNLSIVQISDVHIGSRFTAADIRRAMLLANSLQPDLVVLTGDFAYHDVNLVPEAAAEFGRLQARLGSFAILGNHDYWTNAGLVSESLRRNGIELLTNTATCVDKDSGLWLAGVDDVWSGKPDLNRALKPIPERVPTLLLCHEPDFADQVPARVGLQLSGHTHGGQVRIPGFGAKVLPLYGVKYPAGLARAKETLVYVNRGLGVINPPIRFNCPPEITHLTVHSI